MQEEVGVTFLRLRPTYHCTGDRVAFPVVLSTGKLDCRTGLLPTWSVHGAPWDRLVAVVTVVPRVVATGDPTPRWDLGRLARAVLTMALDVLRTSHAVLAAAGDDDREDAAHATDLVRWSQQASLDRLESLKDLLLWRDDLPRGVLLRLRRGLPLQPRLHHPLGSRLYGTFIHLFSSGGRTDGDTDAGSVDSGHVGTTGEVRKRTRESRKEKVSFLRPAPTECGH